MLFLPLYKRIETGGGSVRFIGMNTGKGFVGCMKDLLRERDLKRTYIIKGAAGTGKSTLMKKAAEHFEKKGVAVSRYLCSSDPGSLDAVLIGGSVVIADGTAPHERDMRYPGASSQLICLCNFWNKDKLTERREEIIALSDEKGRRFRRAYGLLGGMSALSKDKLRDAGEILDTGKAASAASRIIDSVHARSDLPSDPEFCLRSFGMRGAIRLDTFERIADKIVWIRDRYASSAVFMDLLASKLKSERKRYFSSPDPLEAGAVAEIYLPDERTLFTVSETERPYKVVNMDRFIVKERAAAKRGVIRLASKCSAMMLGEAERELAAAAEAHFALERIYGEQMNFDAVNEYTKLLIRDIESLL